MKALLLSALIAVSALPLFAQELVYRSNSFGMLLERIEPYRRDQSDWIMGVSRAGAKEIRRLYSKGKEVRRWEVSVSADGTQRIERELARDVLAARRIYDAGGNLLQEDEYTAGRLAQKSMFTYRGNRLARMRLLKADGSIVYSPAGLTEERNATRDVTFVARYDTRGRLASREQRRGDATLSREDFTYRADSDHLQSSLVTLPGRNEQVVRHYDEEGRLVSENRRASGELAEEIAYTRDEKGRMTGKSRRTPAGLETWKYTLDGDGKTMREEFYRRGLLERVTIYGEGNRRTEDYYRDDSVFLKVYYDGDQRLSEEVFEGGRMVRERHYR
ncbi:MAG: hypothetical protein ABSG63_16290 [Spirochaetia bacterium]